MVEADQGSPIPPVRRVDTIEELVAVLKAILLAYPHILECMILKI